MAKFYQDFYHPVNKEKYLGKRVPYFRSSWELKFMQFLDKHPSVIGWSSESHRIPYIHPFTGKSTTYVPDFFIIYEDKRGVQKAEMIEVKPSSQITGNAKRPYDRAQAAVNDAKWKMARQWCSQQNIGFRIITEQEIFRNPGKK
jgi:hypothetical protein